jgi:hypothetical protein
MARIAFLTLGLVWAGVVGGGLFALGRYDATAGAAATPPASWPAKDTEAAVAAAAPAKSAKPTLLMFVHPRCPCSRASLAELAQVLARRPGRADVRILMMRPDGTDAGWEQTPTRAFASRIAGATVETDAAGTAAGRFGAATSGQVLLYAADGRLAFAGGITGGRGHAGDNAGRQALEAALDALSQQKAAAVTTATATFTAPSDVFGCPLATPGLADPQAARLARAPNPPAASLLRPAAPDSREITR